MCIIILFVCINICVCVCVCETLMAAAAAAVSHRRRAAARPSLRRPRGSNGKTSSSVRRARVSSARAEKQSAAACKLAREPVASR